MKLQPFQERVVEEKKELDEKRDKLRAFMGDAKRPQLPAAECDQLARQLAVMDEYSAILADRIEAFA